MGIKYDLFSPWSMTGIPSEMSSFFVFFSFSHPLYRYQTFFFVSIERHIQVGLKKRREKLRFIGAVKDMSDQIIMIFIQVNFPVLCYRFSSTTVG